MAFRVRAGRGLGFGVYQWMRGGDRRGCAGGQRGFELISKVNMPGQALIMQSAYKIILLIEE